MWPAARKSFKSWWRHRLRSRKKRRASELLLKRRISNELSAKSISTIPTLLGLVTLVSLMSLAADRLPKGWIKAGSHPQNYEIALDAAVKHGDKAAAYIKGAGAASEGFCTLMQLFKANDYHGKRLRMSAWMRTENA